MQVALRELAMATSVDQLLAGRGELGRSLLAAVRGLDELGVALERLELKDIVLPAARGETAALRSLANAARLAADNPALLQIRMLEQLGRSTGHTVVLTAPVVQ